jgi:hypothetical protein
LHYFEITHAQFAAEIADYLPREAFNKSGYLLVAIRSLRRTLLITEIDKLGELMDGLCMRKQCRRIPKRVANTIKRESGEIPPQLIVGNVDLWQNL